MPSGVDAQSWLGFEQRIQERRFKALVESISNAVAARDGIAARLALEEARELRPAAPELQALAARVALLPTGESAAATSSAWYRGLSAVAMFVVGIGLVIGIESLRSTDTTAAPATVAASPVPVAAPAVAADSIGSPSAVITEPVQSTPVSTPAALVADAAPASTPTAVPLAVATTREEPVGTAGVSRAGTSGAAATPVPNRPTFRPAAAEPVEPVVSASREVPDDYVAPGTRSENRAGFTEVPASIPTIAANVMPQPISITAPAPAPAPVLPAVNTVAPTTSAITPRNDSSRVTQVLNQYARAYDRLDPTAARAVWPTVDERALARAFASLESQEVSFDACDIDIKGAVANATCRGTASYVGKVGSRQARTEPRQWTFELKLHGDDWKIEKAQTTGR